jgi:hypothetical protein
MPQFFTAIAIAKAEDILSARPLSHQWVATQSPRTKQLPADMLPTALSPAGQLPATHYLCATSMTQAQFDSMEAFIAANDVPVLAYLAGEQAEAQAQYTLANRDAWLEANGLKVI